MLHHHKSHLRMYVISDVNPELWSVIMPIEYFFHFDYWERTPKDWITKPSSSEDARLLEVNKPSVPFLINPLIRWMAKALIGGQK